MFAGCVSLPKCFPVVQQLGQTCCRKQSKPATLLPSMSGPALRKADPEVQNQAVKKHQVAIHSH